MREEEKKREEHGEEGGGAEDGEGGTPSHWASSLFPQMKTEGKKENRGKKENTCGCLVDCCCEGGRKWMDRGAHLVLALLGRLLLARLGRCLLIKGLFHVEHASDESLHDPQQSQLPMYLCIDASMYLWIYASMYLWIYSRANLASAFSSAACSTLGMRQTNACKIHSSLNYQCIYASMDLF